DYSCIVSQPDVQSGSKIGYCCPSVNINCPTGLPHPNATCSNDFRSSDGSYCPWQTHYCHSFGFGGFAPQMLCCPKDCPTSMVNVNGKCLPSLKVGDQCQDNKQCDSQFSACIEGKGSH
uniref:EB domain-containing protein n=1 Tax=Romanomermis culicivorax TaxID=13658 RepID=A0A915J9I6_ROMCU